MLRNARKQKPIQHRADIACRGQTQHESLHPWRIAAAGHRQRNRKAGASDAQEDSQDQQQVVGRHDWQQQHDRRNRGQRNPQEGQAASVDGLKQIAERHPDDRCSKHRHRDEKAGLRRGQGQLLGNERRQRPEHHPCGETRVEIQETGQQRLPVAALQGRHQSLHQPLPKKKRRRGTQTSYRDEVHSDRQRCLANPTSGSRLGKVDAMDVPR